MRERRINLSHWGISRWAYEELKAFCRQYPEKMAKANALLGIRGGSRLEEHHLSNGTVIYAAMPHGNGVSDPVADAAAKRAPLLADCDLIDRVAAATAGGKWASALVLNCCHGVGYENLDPAVLPNSSRTAFFQARREFFFRLHEEKHNHRVFGTPGDVEM